MGEPTLRVCYFGTYRERYSRNRIMITGLRRNGVTVIECQETLWQGIEDRVNTVSGGWKRPAFWGRILRTYGRLLRRYWSIRHDYDLLIIGYPGQFDVFLGRLLSWWQGKPLVWDVFMSIYLIALERGLAEQSAIAVHLLRRLEWVACRLPDRLILDTAAYVAWFQRTHGVDPTRFRLVPTGADSEQFSIEPRLPSIPTASGDAASTCQVIYYGTFIPNHGVPTIIEAARLLAADEKIQFTLIGQGPERALAMQLAQAYGLTNLHFIEWLSQDELVEYVASADLLLGAFGSTPQSLMTVQNKIYEGLAMGKAVISGDASAVRQALVAGEEIYLCARNDGAALADAIRDLAADPTLRATLADAGQRRFLRDYALEPLGQRYRAHLLEVVAAA